MCSIPGNQSATHLCCPIPYSNQCGLAFIVRPVSSLDQATVYPQSSIRIIRTRFFICVNRMLDLRVTYQRSTCSYGQYTFTCFSSRVLPSQEPPDSLILLIFTSSSASPVPFKICIIGLESSSAKVSAGRIITFDQR